MTNKIEISRELAERIIQPKWTAAGEKDQQAAVADLRALLAAPAVERQVISDGEMIKMINKAAPHHNRDNDLFYLEFGKALQAALIASPPAPVSVVLPEYRDPEGVGGASYYIPVGWNACIDKVKELNT